MSPSVLLPERSQRTHWLVHWWIWFLAVLVPQALVAALVPYPANLILALCAGLWVVAALLTALWIPAYCASLEYTIDEDVIRGSRGVFWRRNVTIPYPKITNVDISQGPLQRRFGIGTIHVQTAGFGGAQGSVAELQMPGIRDLVGVREMIMEKVKSHGARGGATDGGPTQFDLMAKMAKELKTIRKALVKKS